MSPDDFAYVSITHLYTSYFAVSALQVIQQSTGLDLEWEDDPCFPTSWEHIKCEGNSVTTLYEKNVSNLLFFFCFLLILMFLLDLFVGNYSIST